VVAVATRLKSLRIGLVVQQLPLRLSIWFLQVAVVAVNPQAHTTQAAVVVAAVIAHQLLVQHQVVARLRNRCLIFLLEPHTP
jgi:hypothetical protein